jgi:predicted MFS family arabinose efflux permease
VAGAALSAASTQFGWLVLGQVMIGVGCAPAFLACTVFIARNWPAERFAAVSGLVITIGSVGMLATSTPLAWLIEASSWRAGFWVLSAGSAVAWLLVLLLVREISVASPGTSARRESLAGAVRGFGALLLVRHTAGILMLSSVSYAAYIALRGLWLGPLLITRHGFSLVESGNVVLAVSVASLIGPPLFGRLDPGPLARRRWIVFFTGITAALLTMMAFATSAWLDVALACVIALVSGYMVLQYADVRSAYPVSMVGRALSLFTMAMFMGIALVQWLTGLAASHAALVGMAPFTAVLLSLALLLVAGATAFTWLPRPPT